MKFACGFQVHAMNSYKNQYSYKYRAVVAWWLRLGLRSESIRFDSEHSPIDLGVCNLSQRKPHDPRLGEKVKLTAADVVTVAVTLVFKTALNSHWPSVEKLSFSSPSDIK
ncbi:hypothetical protein EVAR_103225_1 [Eumeta japonica]|uniref:Uncharacterized protein n=1 Tax=Eumeta variegata TaxID=151549 RepID=A0A4C1XAA5_EUMVA|nr:hypothetical protein EVAR_103225_1 [Eumeta japonica]